MLSSSNTLLTTESSYPDVLCLFLFYSLLLNIHVCPCSEAPWHRSLWSTLKAEGAALLGEQAEGVHQAQLWTSPRHSGQHTGILYTTLLYPHCYKYNVQPLSRRLISLSVYPQTTAYGEVPYHVTILLKDWKPAVYAGDTPGSNSGLQATSLVHYQWATTSHIFHAYFSQPSFGIAFVSIFIFFSLISILLSFWLSSVLPSSPFFPSVLSSFCLPILSCYICLYTFMYTYNDGELSNNSYFCPLRNLGSLPSSTAVL
jgi:hypothetical protein